MGSHRLGIASSDTATITALPASSTGMPAAISAPNTAISRISVIGTEVSSALWKSWLITVLAAWSVLASPASWTSRPGWLACTRATAARSALTVLSALAFGPATWNVTRAVRPSAEISAWPPGLSGDRMSAAARGSRCSALTTSATAPRSAGSCTYELPGPACPGLDEHALRGRRDHVQLAQHLLGLAGLARVILRLALRAEQVPAEQRHHGQHQPARDHRDPVPCAPARDPLHHRRPQPPPAGPVPAGTWPPAGTGPPRIRLRFRGRRWRQFRQRVTYLGQGRVEQLAHLASRGRGG